MAHKIMAYVLPIMSIVALVIIILFFRPQVTGFFIAQPKLNAEIKITADEILPENAEIHIFLEKDNVSVKEISSSTITEFVNKFLGQEALQYKYGTNSQLNYEGFGYSGSNVFSINLNINDLKAGNYILRTEIIWQDKIVSETEQQVGI